MAHNKISKYRKLPVLVEACQISTLTEYAIIKWSEGKVYASPVLEPTEYNKTGEYWQIKTAEGIMTAVPGDWIIKGVNGEFYPCKDSVFNKVYEEVK